MKKLKPYKPIKKYYSHKIVKQLNLKNDCLIRGTTIYMLSDHIWSQKLLKMIDNPEKKHDLGNKSQGKLDYLVKYHNFIINYVESLKDFKK